MTAQLRRKGTRISSRLRADAAVLQAEDRLTRTEQARTLRVGRETLRGFSQGPDGDLYKRWVSIAQRRLGAGISRERIIDELVETVEPWHRELTPASAKDEWIALRHAAAIFADAAAAWNIGRTSHVLETDIDLLIALAAEHADVNNLMLGHPEVGRVTKLFLNSTLDRGAAIKPLPGCFLPWKPFPYPKETEP